MTQDAIKQQGQKRIVRAAFKDTWAEVAQHTRRSLAIWCCTTAVTLWLQWKYFARALMEDTLRALITVVAAGVIVFAGLFCWRAALLFHERYKVTRRDIRAFACGVLITLTVVGVGWKMREEPRIDTSRPRLVGRFEGAPFLGTMPNDKGASLLIMQLAVRNTGLPSIIHDWKVYVSRKGGAREQLRVWEPESGFGALEFETEKPAGLVIERSQMIQTKAKAAIPSGWELSGLLVCRAETLTTEAFRGAEIAVVFRDVLDREYEVSDTLTFTKRR